MDEYEIEIKQSLFDDIKSKKCNYIICVNDKVKQQYKVGNFLTVVCGGEIIKVQVKQLLYFQSVKEAIDMISKDDLGYSNNLTIDRIEDYVDSELNVEKIDKFGLIAISFNVV